MKRWLCEDAWLVLPILLVAFTVAAIAYDDKCRRAGGEPLGFFSCQTDEGVVEWRLP